MPTLFIVEPSGARQRVELRSEGSVVGSDRGADIVLQAPDVSSRHAHISRLGANAWWIEDLASKSGVTVEGVAIAEPCRMRPGDEIRIGSFVLFFVADDSRNAAAFTMVGTTVPVLDLQIAFPPGEFIVGRAPDAAVPIKHHSISRHHASVCVISGGVALVEDNDSKNGTYVDDVQVRRAVVRPGQRLRFGLVNFAVTGKRSGHGAITSVRDAARVVAELETTTKAALAMGLFALVVAAIVTTMLFRGGAYLVTPIPVPPGADQAETDDAAEPNDPPAAQAFAEAELQLGQRQWKKAAAAFQRVLERRPQHARSQAGLRRANANLAYEETLAQAAAALDADDAAGAETLLSATPVPDDMREQGAALLGRARATLGAAILQRATQACATTQWADCQREAAACLKLDAQAVAAAALIQEAERWLAAGDETLERWPADAATLAALADLERTYHSSIGKAAAARYATGDFDTTERRARSMGRSNPDRRLLNLVGDYQRSVKQAQAAATQQDWEQARSYWERALAVDAQILPTGYPSVPRADATAGLGDALLHLGDAD